MFRLSRFESPVQWIIGEDMKTRLLALILTAILTGCGDEEPGLVDVSGVVTWEGRPVASGNIIFVPESGAASDPDSKGPHVATSFLDADGSFQMTTFKLHDGVIPGKYRVGIDTSPPAPVEDLSGVNPPQEKGPIPARYADPTRSGLAATIDPSNSTQQLDFNLPLTDESSR